MKEYHCRKCSSLLKVTFSKDEIPSGRCPKCKNVYKNLNKEIENHLCYRDNLRHCPNCGKEFRTNCDPRRSDGYDLKTHTCPRCGWLVGWQQTFSHGEYVVAMESAELFDQRMHFFKQLRKHGMPDAAGDGEYHG